MAETKTQMRKPFKGAKVDWPADMPDDMLEDAITVAKNALETHDFEEQGVEVSAKIEIWWAFNEVVSFADCINCQETHGREMGAILARFLGQELRLPRCA